MGLEDVGDVDLSPAKGALFETAVLSELSKAYLACGRRPRLSYWRDAAKREIDLLVERGTQLSWAIEAKSSTTYSPKFFRHLDSVGVEPGVPVERRVVAYAGSETFGTSHGLVCALADLAGIVQPTA